MSLNDGLGAFFAFLMSFFIICGLISLVIYVLGAVWEMQFLQRIGYDKPWLAWIPFGNFVAMGAVAFDEDSTEEDVYLFRTKAPIWLFKYFTLLLVAANLILNMIPFVGAFTWIIDILAYLAFYVPIMKGIAKRLGVEVSDGRCILDSIITLVGFYDVWAWSENTEFSTVVKKTKYADTMEDATVMDLDDNSPSMQ